MGISFVSDEMEDLLEGGVKLTIPRIGLGPELALPVMKIVLHEELEIKTLQAPLVPGHEQKGISSDHGGQNLRVVGFAILVVVEVLGQDDGGMLDFLGGVRGVASTGIPKTSAHWEISLRKGANLPSECSISRNSGEPNKEHAPRAKRRYKANGRLSSGN